MPRIRFRYRSLEDFVTANELSVDAVLEDGWGAPLSVKGRELEVVVLFADISAFTERTVDMTPVETLAYVNTFFTWMTAEALNEGPGIIDKYIGDEVMVVYAKEFGSQDPVEDALRAGYRMCRNDVLDFGPHIGVAAGPAIVGYAGTPVRHNCSVFGAAVALAARCSGVEPHTEKRDQRASHTITFPADLWTERRDLDSICEPTRYRDPETRELEEDSTASSHWKVTDPFEAEFKGLGAVHVRQLQNPGIRINNFTVEDRTRQAVEKLREANRYWPKGRHPQVP